MAKDIKIGDNVQFEHNNETIRGKVVGLTKDFVEIGTRRRLQRWCVHRSIVENT